MKAALLLLALVGACVGSVLADGPVKPMPPLRVEPLPEAVAHKPSRVISGTPAVDGQFPNQAALLFREGWFCGGSLITPCTILTAAHCTDGSSSVTAYLGGVNLYPPRAYQSTQYAQHEDYDGQQIINDVAVIYFPGGISGPNIGLVAGLAPPDAPNYAGEAAIASGWGITRDGGSVSPVLNWVTINIITPDLCAWYYGSSAGHPSVICSQGPGNAGVCSGDSGGPLVQASTGIQIGIMSFAAANACEAGYPSGYARVSYLRRWIDEHTLNC